MKKFFSKKLVGLVLALSMLLTPAFTTPVKAIPVTSIPASIKTKFINSLNGNNARIVMAYCDKNFSGRSPREFNGMDYEGEAVGLYATVKNPTEKDVWLDAYLISSANPSASQAISFLADGDVYIDYITLPEGEYTLYLDGPNDVVIEEAYIMVATTQT